jgi:hypothetical protein
MKHVAIALMGIFCIGTLNAAADDTAKLKPYKDALTGVPAVEMPAKAAEVVKQAKTQLGDVTTANVVRAAVEVNPMATPAVVGAIARALPDMAPVAAGTAAEAQPKQAVAFARAAAVSAPSKAARIVVAVCHAVPAAYRGVVLAVAQAVPGSSKEILAALGSALPQLRPAIEKALAESTGDVLSVVSVLDQVAATPGLASVPVDASGALRGPPSFGAPYQPPSPNPGFINANAGIPLPPNVPRHYSAP